MGAVQPGLPRRPPLGERPRDLARDRPGGLDPARRARGCPEGTFGAGPLPVATFSSWTKTLNAGAATVPVHMISDVTVSPAHRRRGLLRRMMVDDLAQATAPVAALTVSRGVDLRPLRLRARVLPPSDRGRHHGDVRAARLRRPGPRRARRAGRPLGHRQRPLRPLPRVHARLGRAPALLPRLADRPLRPRHGRHRRQAARGRAPRRRRASRRLRPLQVRRGRGRQARHRDRRAAHPRHLRRTWACGASSPTSTSPRGSRCATATPTTRSTGRWSTAT